MHKFPQIFYGTAWKKQKTADLVCRALVSGFRGIDTACQPKHYNQAGVGEGIKLSKIARQKLFIQTKFTSFDGQDPNKIPYDPKDCLRDQIKTSLTTSLTNLKIDYIDSLVLHGPLHTFAQTLQAWRVFQEFVEQNKVRYLGISNCYDFEYFRKLYDAAKVKPSFLQNRFYAETGYDRELRKFCRENSIVYQSFWTLTANPHLLKSQVIKNLSKKYKVEPQQILYRVLTKINVIPLIGTTSNVHMKQDLSMLELNLQEDEIKSVTALFE